jgi:hypothetical protein
MKISRQGAIVMENRKKGHDESPIPMVILLTIIALGAVGLVYSIVSG